MVHFRDEGSILEQCCINTKLTEMVSFGGVVTYKDCSRSTPSAFLGVIDVLEYFACSKKVHLNTGFYSLRVLRLLWSVLYYHALDKEAKNYSVNTNFFYTTEYWKPRIHFFGHFLQGKIAIIFMQKAIFYFLLNIVVGLAVRECPEVKVLNYFNFHRIYRCFCNGRCKNTPKNRFFANHLAGPHGMDRP